MSKFDGLLDAECNDLYDALVSSILHQNSNAFDFPKMPYFVAKNAKICHCCFSHTRQPSLKDMNFARTYSFIYLGIVFRSSFAVFLYDNRMRYLGVEPVELYVGFHENLVHLDNSTQDARHEWNLSVYIRHYSDTVDTQRAVPT